MTHYNPQKQMEQYALAAKENDFGIDELTAMFSDMQSIYSSLESAETLSPESTVAYATSAKTLKDLIRAKGPVNTRTQVVQTPLTQVVNDDLYKGHKVRDVIATTATIAALGAVMLYAMSENDQADAAISPAEPTVYEGPNTCGPQECHDDVIGFTHAGITYGTKPVKAKKAELQEDYSKIIKIKLTDAPRLKRSKNSHRLNRGSETNPTIDLDDQIPIEAPKRSVTIIDVDSNGNHTKHAIRGHYDTRKSQRDAMRTWRKNQERRQRGR